MYRTIKERREGGRKGEERPVTSLAHRMDIYRLEFPRIFQPFSK